jgi:hypothetical protein
VHLDCEGEGDTDDELLLVQLEAYHDDLETS